MVRGNSLLSYIAKDTPTFDNSRCTNFIDLTLTNAKVHDPMDQWQVVTKDMDENCSYRNFITYKISSILYLKFAEPNSHTLPKLIGKFTRLPV